MGTSKKVDNWKARAVGYGLVVLNIVFHLLDINISLYRTVAQSVGEIEMLVGLLLIRILIAIWVYNIAKKLDRSTLFWTSFALIAPPLCLIIIGYLGIKGASAPIVKKRIGHIEGVVNLGGLAVMETSIVEEHAKKDEEQYSEKQESITLTKCPACGFKITDAMEICPDCELALK